MKVYNHNKIILYWLLQIACKSFAFMVLFMFAFVEVAEGQHVEVFPAYQNPISNKLLNKSARIRIPAGVQMYVIGSGALINNDSTVASLTISGTVNVAGNMVNDSAVRVYSGGNLTVQGDLTNNITGYIRIDNSLTVNGNINNDSVIYINSTGTINANGNLTNSTVNTNASIQSDGIINIKGNWINNGKSTISYGTPAILSNVNFIGTALQNISGTQKTIFENLTLNNNSGLSITGSQRIDNVLTLSNTNALITTGTDTLFVNNNSNTAIVGYNATRYINGHLKRLVTGNTTYDLPVGSTVYNELLTLELLGTTGLNYLDVCFTVDNTQTPPGGLTVNTIPINSFLNYGYWTISPNTGATYTYNINARSNGQTNGGGTTPDQFSLISDIGSGWANNGFHSCGTQTISSPYITARRTSMTSFGNFIIGYNGSNQLYYQPPITNVLKNKAAKINLGAGSYMYALGNNASLKNDSSIAKIDASTNVRILVNGDFLNRTSTLQQTSGKITVNGNMLDTSATVTLSGIDTLVVAGTLTNKNSSNFTQSASGGILTVQTNIINDLGSTLLSAGITNLTGNFTNDNSSVFKLDGTFNIAGNWTNNATSQILNSSTNTEGTVNFNGSTAQTIGGSQMTIFEKMKISNNNGVTLINTVNQEVDSLLTFNSTGNITTGSNSLIIKNPANTAISGYAIPSSAPSGYINGNLRRYVNGNTNYDLPVGNGTNYELAQIELLTTTGLNYLDINFTLNNQTVPGGLTVLNTPINVFLDYAGTNGYWTITPDAGTYTYNLNTYSLSHTSLGGTTDQYSLISDIGSGWSNYGTHSAGTQQFTGSYIKARRTSLTVFGKYLIGKTNSSSLYNQPSITNTLKNKGSRIMLGNNSKLYVLGNNATLKNDTVVNAGWGANINAGTGVTILVNGDFLNRSGNFTQNSGAITVNGNMTDSVASINFSGAVAETISGTLTNKNSSLFTQAAGSTITVQGNILNDQNSTISPAGILNLTGNFTNNNSSALKLDGTFNISGNWTNNATSAILNSATTTVGGTVNFNGTANQKIGGSQMTIFEKMTISNNSGVTLINTVDQEIDSSLTFNSTGNITTGTNTLIVINKINTAISGYALPSSVPSGYIDGNLRRYVAQNTNYDLPVGNGTNYELAQIELLTTSGLNYLNVNFNLANQTVPGGLTVLNTPINVFLDYSGINGYWKISPDAGTYTYNLNTYSLNHTNLGGTPDQYSLISNVGSGWSNYGTHSAGTQQFIGSYIKTRRTTLTAFGSYITGKTNSTSLYNQPPITNVMQNKGAAMNFGTGSVLYVLGNGANIKNNKTTATGVVPIFDVAASGNTVYVNGDVNNVNSVINLNNTIFTITGSLYNLSGSTITQANGGKIIINNTLTNRSKSTISTDGKIWVNVNLQNVDTSTISQLSQTDTIFVTGNFNNYTNSALQLDGCLNLQGNWVNNGIAGIARTTTPAVFGTVIFRNSTSPQVIDGTTKTVFENLIDSNSIRLDLNINTDISKFLKFSKSGSLINTFTDTLKILNTSSTAITGYNGTMYINGNLRRYVSNLNNYDLPVGDLNNYEYAKLELTGSTGLTYVDVNFITDATQVPPPTLTVTGMKVFEFLNYGYWHIVPNSGAITNLSYNLTIQSRGHTNGGGTPDYYTMISDVGSGWSDYGLQSLGTQGFSGNDIYAKRSVLNVFGNYTIGKMNNPNYIQPPITNELRIKGASLKVPAGGGDIYVLGNNATVNNLDGNLNATAKLTVASGGILSVNGNFLNDTSSTLLVNGTLTVLGNLKNNLNSTISIDGTLNLTGNFTNNAVSSMANTGTPATYGTVNLNGTGVQTIDGTSVTYFENLINNNQNATPNWLQMNNDLRVDQVLTLTKGGIITNSNKIIINNTATNAIVGYYPAGPYYINGNLRRMVAASNTYDLPVGTTLNYELANIQIAAGATGLSYLDVNFTEDNTQSPPALLTVNGLLVNEFLNYGYWNIIPNSGVGSYNYILTLISRGQSNGGGLPTNYTIISNLNNGGWQDYGIHNNVTQQFFPLSTDIYVVRTGMSYAGAAKYIIGKMINPPYNQPIITNELRNKGAKIRIEGSDVYVLGSNAQANNDQSAKMYVSAGRTLSVNGNVLNDNSSLIQVDGTSGSAGTLTIVGDINNNNSSTVQINGLIQLQGNWNNNAVSSLAMGDLSVLGKVNFAGTAGTQYINGTSSTYFENLTVNNANNVTLNITTRVDSLLDITNGGIITNNDTIIVKSKKNNVIIGYSGSRYINGTLRKYVNSSTTYDIPVGTSQYYELANIKFNSATSLNYIDVNFTVDNTQTPPNGLFVNGVLVNDFLDYGYWTINPNTGVAGLNYDLTLTARGQSNGGGLPANYAIISDIGSGWTNVGIYNGVNQSINGSDIIVIRTAMNSFGKHIVGKLYDKPYNQPIITNGLRNKGASIVISNAGVITTLGANNVFNNDSINSSNGILDILQGGIINLNGDLNNNNGGIVKNDGTINEYGMWNNFGHSSIANTTTPAVFGTVVFAGSSVQTINGSSVTYFENLTNNNQNATPYWLQMNNDVRVDQVLNLTSGGINTGTNRLTVNNAATTAIQGYSGTYYVNGNLRRMVSAGSSYDLPIGTSQYYELAQLNLTSATGLNYLDVNYIADNTQTPPLGLTVNGLPVTVFLNYGYWNISPNSGVSALNYNLTLTARGQTNGGGAKEDYTIISNIGSGWANVGTHNNSTQSFSGSDIIAVRNAMNTLGSFIFGKMYNVSYNQPVITNTLSITGADVRVMNAGQLTVIGSNSGINNYQSALLQIDQGGSVNLDGNVTNNTNSSIQIDGNLNLKGNWYNNAISSLALTTTPAQRGTVTFQGASGSQAIGGISTTYFENLTLNNSSGLSMVSNVRVDSLMTFTNGIINTGVDTLILTCKRTDIFSGTFSATKYINGTLKKYVTNGATPYDLPIGTASNYEYAKVWINTQTGLSYITVNFNVDNSQTPPVGLMAGGTLPITSFMNYGYWTVKPNVSISAVNYDIQVQSSGQSNGGGVPSEYALVPDLGAGWVDAGGYLAGNQSFNGSNIIAKRTALTSFGSYIVGRNATPVIYPVTNNVRNKGAVIKIQNGKTFNIQGQGADLNNSNVAFTVTADAASAININGNLNNSDNSEFRTLGNATINENVNNNSSALITVDGTLNINGNWINNAIANTGFSCTSAKGTVVFGRTDSVQTIDGSVITQFENLTVNNVNGVRLLTDEEVGSILTFTTGKIYTGSNKLVLKSTGTDVITGNNTSNYVYGNLRKYVSTGSYILPIGDSLNYELATLEVVNASNLNYVDVNFTKSVQTPPAGLTVQNIPITQFLNYGYWTISGNAGCNNFKYNITLQSIGQTNGGGLPELYAVIPDTFTGNWIDYGSHVVSTQVVTVNSVTAKRSYLSQFGRFEIGKATSAIYNQIAITNQLKNKGAVLRIGNNKTVNLQGGFAELDNVNSGILKSYGTVNVYKNILNDYGGLVYNYGTIYTQSNYINSHGSDIMNFGTLNIDSNITNELHSIIRIDGTINIKGNWINNGIQKLALNDASTLGTVSFIGSSTQYIKGTAKTEFENLTINNPQNVVLSNDQVVDSLLTFNSGIIKTGSYKLTLVSKNINAIAGYSNTKYIAGNLRRYVGNATYDLPVGDTAYYELANIQVVNNTDLNYIDVFFTRNNSQVVPGGLKVQNTPITSFLNYGYWNINSNTECSSVNYNLSVQSNGHSNGGGTTDMYCVITDTTTAGNSWQDIGVHSNSTQIIQGSYIIAKRSVYTRFGKYIIAKADGSIYNQPLITNELINKGAVVRINGKTLNLQGANGIDYNTSNAFTKINSSGTFNIDVDLNNNSGTNFISQGTLLIKGNVTNNGSKLTQYSGTINCNNNIVNSGNATLTVLGIVNVNGNLTNLDNSSIQLDGTINLTGIWLNNGTPSIIRSGGNIGTVNFNGINYQTISGSSVTEFANLTLNNSNHLYLYQNIIVDSLLTFTNGKLKTNANMVIVKSTRTDVINNYNASRYIHGNLRRYVTNATYELPVGDTLYYELAKIQIYANTGLSYIDVHFTKDANSTPPAGLKVQGTPILSFLNYGYWTIIPNSGYTSAGYNLQIQSQGHTNGGGTADLYSLISDIGSGWTDYGVHSNSTQIINNPYISAVRTVMSQFGNYKIGKSSGEIYNQPPITNELNNKGANIRIFNTSVVNVQGINAEVDNSKLYGVIDIKPSASLNNSGNLYNSNSARIQVEGLLVNSGNIQNNSNAAIQIDGNINMYGTSWINNAISNTALGDLTKRGTVNFMSTTSLQTLSGTSKTYFENLNVNNSYGISLLKGQRVDSLLIFTKGKVYTNTDTIFMTSVKTDAIRNYNSNYYIVGNLRRYVKNQTYDLPVGDSLRYELANIEIDNSNNLNYVDVKFVTKNIQDSATKLATPIFVSNTKINQFLNYGYWVINGNAGFTNLNCRISCQSQGHTNGGGYPENYALITDAGGGWQDIGVHSATTQIINSSYISAKRSVLNVLGRFIIGKSFNDIYNQAPLTNELMNKGAVIKILTGKTLNITGIAAEIDNTNSAVLQIVNTAIINNDGHVYNNNLAKIYNDGNLNLKGNWINNSRADISDGNANKGIVAFTGNAIQFIGGDSKTKFEKVTINNTNLGVRLSNNIYISDVLTMTDGDLDLGNDTIDLGFTGTLTGETKDNRIKALGAGNVEGMGKGTIIAGAIINGVTNLNVGGLGMMITTSGNLDTTYVVRGHKRDTINSTLYSINRHYNVTPKNQGILTTLNMNYFDIEWSTITGVEQYMVMYHNHGGTWSSMKSNNVNTNTNILSATTTTFSDFTGVIADPSISLPVEYVDFIAKALDNKYVMLNWQTYSENNSDYFIVERSRNAVDFEDLLTVNAAGKSNSIKIYTNYDENPYKGVSFYRLRQVDMDGKIKYTETRTVEILETLNERNLSVYPNPTNADLGLNLKFSGYNPEEQILIMILDLTGKVIMTRIIYADDNGNKVEELYNEINLPKGLYFVVAQNQNKILTRKIIIN